jgi:hypothetical protein
LNTSPSKEQLRRRNNETFYEQTAPLVNDKDAWQAPEKNLIRNKLRGGIRGRRWLCVRPQGEQRRMADAGLEEGEAAKQSQVDLKIHFPICYRLNRKGS